MVGSDDLPTGRHEAMHQPEQDGPFRALLSHDRHSVVTHVRADGSDRPLSHRS
ncbi:hypothetical protein SPW_3684 [Streptomyces sp. W007]|nr:hypothetical protein SPW_3684 [Streptomyces sp. W007]